MYPTNNTQRVCDAVRTNNDGYDCPLHSVFILKLPYPGTWKSGKKTLKFKTTRKSKSARRRKQKKITCSPGKRLCWMALVTFLNNADKTSNISPTCEHTLVGYRIQFYNSKIVFRHRRKRMLKETRSNWHFAWLFLNIVTLDRLDRFINSQQQKKPTTRARPLFHRSYFTPIDFYYYTRDGLLAACVPFFICRPCYVCKLLYTIVRIFTILSN